TACIGGLCRFQLGDDLLLNQIVRDGSDAGVAEAGPAGERGTRHGAVQAQGAEHQAPVLPPDAVTIADVARQAVYSSPRMQHSIPQRLSQSSLLQVAK